LSSARAARTLRNYRLPALKRVCYALTRRLSWPLAGDMFGLYLARLYKERDNIGAPTTTENAMSLLCSMNDVDPAPYNMLRVTAVVEAARRNHKRVVKKSAGLTVGLMWHISRRHAFAQPGRARELQREFAFGRSCRWRSRSCCATTTSRGASGTLTTATCSTRTCASTWRAAKRGEWVRFLGYCAAGGRQPGRNLLC